MITNYFAIYFFYVIKSQRYKYYYLKIHEKHQLLQYIIFANRIFFFSVQ